MDGSRWRELCDSRDVSRLLSLFLLLQFRPLMPTISHAARHPDRPLAGGQCHCTLCRQLAPGLADHLGQPVVVENRPGAGSTIATAMSPRLNWTVAGWSWRAADRWQSVPHCTESCPISTTGFSPIAIIAEIPFVLVVNPPLPIRSVPELIKDATEA